MSAKRALEVLQPKPTDLHTIIVSLHAEVRWLELYPNCPDVDEEIKWAVREQPHVSPGVVQALAARKKADDGSTYVATPDRAGIIVGVKSGSRFTVVTVLRLGLQQVKWMRENYPIEQEDVEEPAPPPAPPKPDDLVEPHLKRSGVGAARLPKKSNDNTAGLAMFRRILNARPHLVNEARIGCPYASAILKHLDDMVADLNTNPNPNTNPKESP
jgi:hypothetical protein